MTDDKIVNDLLEIKQECAKMLDEIETIPSDELIGSYLFTSVTIKHCEEYIPDIKNSDQFPELIQSVLTLFEDMENIKQGLLNEIIKRNLYNEIA